jgi:hypothetical protein
MSQADLEQRVAALEKQMSALREDGIGVRRKDWQRTIGMFTCDEVMEQIFAEGRKIREADRRQASKSRPRGSRGRS